MKQEYDDPNFQQLMITTWDDYSTQSLLDSYLMEVRNPLIIDSINQVSKEEEKKKRENLKMITT